MPHARARHRRRRRPGQAVGVGVGVGAGRDGAANLGPGVRRLAACSVGSFISLLVREEILLVGLCERKILFQLKIYDRL